MPTKAIGDSVVYFKTEGGARLTGHLYSSKSCKSTPCAFVIISMHMFADLTLKYFISSQNSRATFASSPFSYRGKRHSVRLRGVDPKIHRKRPKKERLKNWFVSTKMSEAWLLVTCCCCEGHATAPTHHIGRLCKRRALFALARGELSGFLNTKLSVGGVFRRVFGRAILAPLERKSFAFPTATNTGTTIICRELQSVAST